MDLVLVVAGPVQIMATIATIDKVLSMTIQCKCGVEWASILYGNTCAKCGDIRPAINPIRKTIDLNAHRNEILDMHSTLQSAFSDVQYRTAVEGEFIGSIATTSTQPEAKDLNLDIQALAKILKDQRELETEHNEILKEVAEILKFQNRECQNGEFVVYLGEVESLYQQVKEKRRLMKRSVHFPIFPPVLERSVIGFAKRSVIGFAISSVDL